MIEAITNDKPPTTSNHAGVPYKSGSDPYEYLFAVRRSVCDQRTKHHDARRNRA